MPSHYVTIGGKRYDRALYEEALKAVNREGDGRISRADAEKLLEKVLDAAPGQKDVYTAVEKATVKFLRDTMQWTDAGDRHFRETIHKVAALKGWQTRLPQPGDVDTPPAVTPPPVDGAPGATGATELVRRVAAEYGLGQMRILMSEDEAQAQMRELGGSVAFEQALRQSLDSFLRDGSDGESPLEVLRNCLPLPGVPATPEAAVVAFANRPTTTLALIPRTVTDAERDAGYQTPEWGEQVAQNWVFSLYLPDLSDHLHWAITARDGSRPTYNYGFN